MKLWLVSVKKWQCLDHAVVRAEYAEQAVRLAAKKLPHEVQDLEVLELIYEGHKEVVYYCYLCKEQS